MPLPDRIRLHMESFFGADLSAVRLHVGPEPSMIGAYAFTNGRDIYFDTDVFDLSTVGGRRMLAHELVHVLQQSGGRAHRAVGDEIAVLDDRALEVEADLLAEQAAVFEPQSRSRMVVAEDGSFRLSIEPGLRYDDVRRMRGWQSADAVAPGIVQRVVAFAAWWNGGTAGLVEAYVQQYQAAFPGNTDLWHGTNTLPFYNGLTSFNGSEQTWVNRYFQLNLAQNAACGPGIYGADARVQATAYGNLVMKTVRSTLQPRRYLDISGAVNWHGAAFSAQDMRRYAYKCVLKYTGNYFAVKDCRVEWDPD